VHNVVGTNMMNDAFVASPWPGLIAWITLYVSDFLLTMTCARLYQAGAREHIAFEGSYEITPYYQQDVDTLRLVSPRFLSALTASSLLLCLTWWLTVQGLPAPQLYLFALGSMVLLELTIHVRHLRNLFLFRAILQGEGVRGRIEYDRPVVLRLSSIELLACAGLFAAIFLVTGSWFVLGGAASCVSAGAKHLMLARQHVSRAAAA
jgi:hypothetical protein